VPQTLLLADDSATIQRVIELTFAGEDIKVVAVSDGDQAIARIESAPPDIVLADIGMPGKTGYEVAEYVKHTPKFAHIPVVLLTGAFEPVDQAKADAAGCDGVLAKPFEPQIVIGRVKELLSKGGGAPAPAAVSEVASEPEPRPSSEEPRVEDYFDRLDAAFASMGSQTSTTVEPDLASTAQTLSPELDVLRPNEEAPQDFAVADELAADPLPAPDVESAFAAEIEPAPPTRAPEPEPAPIKVVAYEPPPPTPAPREPIEPREPVAPRGPVAPREPRALPSIADAFSAILAAEQNALGVRPEWPTHSHQAQAAAPPPPAEIVITDELIERVARRVLEQMSDRVVRETVTQIASDVAERLVREEIDRIKAAVK